MRLSALSTAAAERAGVLCCILFMVISAQALAQTSATDNPGPTAAQPSVAEQEKPATAAEKPAIAQDKPAAVEEKSAATDDKSAIVEQKPASAEAASPVAQD